MFSDGVTLDSPDNPNLESIDALHKEPDDYGLSLNDSEGELSKAEGYDVSSLNNDEERL